MIAIVDYKAGNSASVKNVLEYLGFESVVTADHDVIKSADRVIFPGVGAADSAMDSLKEGALDALLANVIAAGKPVLAICIGCQVVLSTSEEDGGVSCMDVIPGQAIRFNSEPGLKIPHMGWNQVNRVNEHELWTDIKDGAEFYFVHSYYPNPSEKLTQFSKTTYGTQEFCSAMIQGSLLATQFHVEKSGVVGLQLMKNFCNWNPTTGGAN
ncbi:MAG: imidazole glycerol phosphate synthase subunit HisH [Fibrobacterales bacterium]